MTPFSWFRGSHVSDGEDPQSRLLLPVHKQLRAWRKADRKMEWGIRKEDFDAIGAPPSLSGGDRREGFVGVGLFYGFGDDGLGNSDSVLSGKVAWDYARKRKKGKTWQCEYIDFQKSDNIRLRPGAPSRPKGFYYAELQLGEGRLNLTVSKARKGFDGVTGWGPEGLQFLAITHPHFQDMMNERAIHFMALADYDVAPYGYNDFFDAAQLFCSNGVFGLGIGNVDRDYPMFGIPVLRIRQGED
jgi:hypothetical protein